jgi:hypothetical protein
MKTKMTKEQVIADLKSICVDCQYYKKNDKIACSQCFNDYTDMLCKDGLITQDQYDNWSNPF